MYVFREQVLHICYWKRFISIHDLIAFFLFLQAHLRVIAYSLEKNAACLKLIDENGSKIKSLRPDTRRSLIQTKEGLDPNTQLLPDN